MNSAPQARRVIVQTIILWF